MTQGAGQILEFPQVVALLRRFVSSPLGLSEIEKLHPLADRAPAERELAELGEAMEWLRGGREIRFHGLHDVRPAAAQLGIEGAELEPVDIFHLLELLDRAGDVKSVLASGRARFPLLGALADLLGEFRGLLGDLAGKILPNGQLDDHASAALRRIRREIERQRRAVQESLDRFVRAHSQEGILQEDYVTIRNERLVVPIITGQKRRIEGVIHGSSSTGQTLFVEPLESIELNNQLVRLAEEETRETHRILREMTARLARDAESIAASAEVLARLEALFARARFGLDFDAAVPRFSPPEAPRLHLRNARHPLLEDLLRARKQSTIPASVTLDRERSVLIISGPNTGGKTVALKTVGLLALMAQAGLPVPAEEAEFPWFSQVLADIGDYQSIQESLSTFSAHVTALREMIAQADAGSLALIDELGTATDPQEGGALAVAVVDHFRRAGAFTMVSTHLPALKVYGTNTPGVINASLGFDEETLTPTYQLEVGLPGKSAGLEIARRLGLPEHILESAGRALTTQDVETAAFLRQLRQQVDDHRKAEAELAAARLHLARREKELEREWEKRQSAKLQDLERRLEAVLQKFSVESTQAIEKLVAQSSDRRAGAEAARRATRAGRELREEFEATVASTLDEARQGRVARPAIAEGAVVRLRGLTTAARVRRRLGEQKWEVEAGPLRMEIDADDVLEVLPAAAPRPRALPEGVRFQPASKLEATPGEINVIGATAEEARDRVDKFLDTAVVSGKQRVRVVHGHGHGILRKTLWQMFATHPHVDKYYQAEQQQGGAGATVVELKIC